MFLPVWEEKTPETEWYLSYNLLSELWFSSLNLLHFDSQRFCRFIFGNPTPGYIPLKRHQPIFHQRRRKHILLSGPHGDGFVQKPCENQAEREKSLLVQQHLLLSFNIRKNREREGERGRDIVESGGGFTPYWAHDHLPATNLQHNLPH